MMFKEKDEIFDINGKKLNLSCTIQKLKKLGRYIDGFEKLYLRIGIKSIHGGGVGKLYQQN